MICYSNNSKNQLLGLEKELKKNDVISEVIAKKMAINVTRYSKNKNVIGVSCTGLASEINKNLSKMKIGTVFFAVYYKNKVKVKKSF